ncbi:MAG: hypothetical protein WC437_01745 [Patescibacteria group bacterium]|nr:hypothetical protein [Patescibacteria group bacterium]
MIETEEKYILTRGPSEIALNACYHIWVGSNSPISFVTQEAHYVVEVSSIERPLNEDDPWIISGRLPNNKTICVRYYAKDREDGNNRTSGIASFQLNPSESY